MPSSQKPEYCCLAHAVTSLGPDVLQRVNAQGAAMRKTIGKQDLLLKLTSAMVTELAKNDLLAPDPNSPSSKPVMFMGYHFVIDDSVIDWEFVVKP